jgi:hypothetical protein
MTATGRIRQQFAAGINLALSAALIFIILPLACCGQSSDNPLKLNNNKIYPHMQRGDRAGMAQPQTPPHEYVPDEVLVKFNPDTNPETIARIQAELKLETVRKFRSPSLFLMKITDGASVEVIIKQLKTYPSVKYAEPNYVVKANP